MNNAEYIDDLKETLEYVTSQSLFGSRRSGAIDSASLGQLFKGQKWNEYISRIHEFNQVIVDASLLSIYTNKLENLLSKYLNQKSKTIGNGMFLLLGGSGRMARPCLDDFAKILILSAAKISATRVTELLVGWANGEPLRFKNCVLLEGVEIKKELKLEEGISLSKLPISSVVLPASLPSLSGTDVTDYLGGVVLSVDCEASPSLYKPEEADDESLSSLPELKLKEMKGRIPNFSVDRFCDAMALSCNHYVRWQTFWRDMGEIQAFSNSIAGGSFRPKTMVSRVNFSQQELEEARRIHKIRYPTKQKRTSRRDIDLAINRWMNSKRSSSNEDRLIELRIALEALYGKGERAEKRFRISSYGAWYLGNSFEERRKYYDTLKKVYDDASQAIHAGKLKHTIDAPDLLSEGQDLCRRGILKRLSELKEPNWDELILGKPEKK